MAADASRALDRPHIEPIDDDARRAQVVLGLEVRMKSVKGAPVDTDLGDFVRPGVATKIPEFTKEEVGPGHSRHNRACVGSVF